MRTEMLRTYDFSAMVENYIFYIFATYEFSHSLLRGDDSGLVRAKNDLSTQESRGRDER